MSHSLHAKSQHVLADALSAAYATLAWHTNALSRSCMLVSYDDSPWWSHAATVSACTPSATHLLVQILHACVLLQKCSGGLMLQECLQKHACQQYPICFVAELPKRWTHAATVSACIRSVTHLFCCRTSQTPSTLQASLTASCGLATRTRMFASGDLRPCPGRAEHRGCSWDLEWSSSLWLPSHSTHNTIMSIPDTGCERLAMAKHECREN